MDNEIVLIVDDDQAVRDGTARLLKRAGYEVGTYESGDLFLTERLPDNACCVLLDVRMPGTDGIEVLRILESRDERPPVIVLTGHGDIPLTVQAMRLGAVDFLEKPYAPDMLLKAIESARRLRSEKRGPAAFDPAAQAAVAGLTWRQRQVLAGILLGHPNKIIAYELGLSNRTVEAYRAQLLARLKVRGTAEAVKLAIAAGMDASEFGRAEAPDGVPR